VISRARATVHTPCPALSFTLANSLSKMIDQLTYNPFAPFYTQLQPTSPPNDSSLLPPTAMCTETHLRFRPCNHTTFNRWDYCSVIIPADRLPDTGHACRRYRLKYEDHQAGGCLNCLHERALTGESLDGVDGSTRREGWWARLRRVFACQ
jgi:hypothetical protein